MIHPITLKISLEEDERIIKNFSSSQWDKITQKLEDSFRKSLEYGEIKSFNKEKIPFVEMEISEEDDEISEESLIEIANILANSEIKVELDNDCYEIIREIVFEDEKEEKGSGDLEVLENFKKLALDLNFN